MLNRTTKTENWKTELRECLRTSQDLCEAGFISESEMASYTPLLARYEFRLPRYYAGLIDPSDPQCPIRLQAIPRLEELEDSKVLQSDPLQDLAHQPVSRITHRYPNRLLIHLTSYCSMYCRFCFRKSLLNELKPSLFSNGIDGAIRYVGEHPEVREVIFSGGDPFLVDDDSVGVILKDLAKIPHLKRVRFHTRIPVTLPSRVTESLTNRLISTRFSPVVVAHFNHPNELTEKCLDACRLLKKAGIILLNQSVLLKRINDSPYVLAQLSERLFEFGVLPYYLHHPDPARGTSLFQISVKEGRAIFGKLRELLPGYLVPKYVKDVVGIPFKGDV